MSDNMGLVPMSAELTMFYHDFESSLAFAAQQERDRIIALLEPFTEHIESCYIDGKLECYPDDCSCYDYEHAIRLIKGEQK